MGLFLAGICFKPSREGWEVEFSRFSRSLFLVDWEVLKEAARGVGSGHNPWNCAQNVWMRTGFGFVTTEVVDGWTW